MKLAFGWFGCFLLIQACQYHTVSPAEHQAALYHTQLGLAYLKNNNRPQAKQKLMQALASDPTSATVHAALGYFMEKTGEIQLAKRHYARAVECDPSGAQLNNYGAFLCRIGQYQLAEHYFKRAIQDKRYQHTGAVYENAGLCALASGREQQAARYFRDALRHDPVRKQSLYDLVQLEVKWHQYHKALADLTQNQALCLGDSTLSALKKRLENRS